MITVFGTLAGQYENVAGITSSCFKIGGAADQNSYVQCFLAVVTSVSTEHHRRGTSSAGFIEARKGPYADLREMV